MHRVAKNLSLPMCVSPSEVEQGPALPSCLSSRTANKCPFYCLFSATLFSIFVLFVEVLAPKHKKVVMCTLLKTCVLDKLPWGLIVPVP